MSTRIEPMSVLLVDDDVAVVGVLRRVLERAGFSVVTATRREEARRLLEPSRFDVIVSDINLPDDTGLALLADARAADEEVPVILLTGGPTLQTAIRAVELGAFRYLLKPTPSDELVAVVRSAARVHRLTKLKSEALVLFRQEALGAGDPAELRASFDRALGSLRLAFQPIVDVGRREPLGYEALMRSSEPTLPDPGAVLEAARLLGRSVELGRVVRRLAADTLAAQPAVTLFVNMNPADLEDAELLSGASPLCAHASRVVLEVTERESLDRVRDVPTKVRSLRSHGFRLAVDDLGAGYSGLTSLAVLEPEFVKLDMVLVRNIHEHQAKQRLVRSMTQLCDEMDIGIIAEGVETQAERIAIESLGCKLLQGYLFARPGAAFPSVSW